jgi:hypothetical protein
MKYSHKKLNIQQKPQYYSRSQIGMDDRGPAAEHLAAILQYRAKVLMLVSVAEGTEFGVL